MPSVVAAYICCYNGAKNLPRAISSLRQQSICPEKILIIDDGSTDASAEVGESHGASVIRSQANYGRGHARATAMEALREFELVVSCDTTVQLQTDFVEKGLKWFKDPKVAAVYGSFSSVNKTTAANRWIQRHYYSLLQTSAAESSNAFATTASIVRSAAVFEVGNYDQSWRDLEDFELGRRLTETGYTIVHDPEMKGVIDRPETLSSALDLDYRWSRTQLDSPTLVGYLRSIWFSLKVTAAKDFRANDPLGAVISLISPHARMLRRLNSAERSSSPPRN